MKTPIKILIKTIYGIALTITALFTLTVITEILVAISSPKISPIIPIIIIASIIITVGGYKKVKTLDDPIFPN